MCDTDALKHTPETDIHMYVNLQFIVAVASFTNMI